MGTLQDGKFRANDIEIVPRLLGSVPAGADGQLSPVTDQPGINLYVRKGGILVPAVDATTAAKFATTEPISMVVDRLTGVSPPAGTIVTTQAQYDTLGASLRLPQDALRILPPMLGDYVKVRCVAGDHWSDPTTLMLLFSPGRMFSIQGKSRTVVDPVLGSINRATIAFYGDTSVYTASQSGTYTGPRSISCPTGTWTTNELRGKFVWFLTGDGAGSRLPIRSNTATTIELGATIEAGSGTFEVRQNDSYLLPTTNGTDTTRCFYLAGLSGDFVNLAYRFFDLNVGSAAKKRDLYVTDYATQYYMRCSITLGVASFAGAVTSYLGFLYGHFTVNGSYPFAFYGPLQSFMISSVIRGKITGLSADYPAPIVAMQGGHGSFDDCVVEPFDGAYAGALLGVLDGELSLNFCLIDGLTTAKGLVLCGADGVGSNPGSAQFVITGTQNINNCTTALQVSAGRLVVISPLSGSGNAKVFSISDGAEVKWKKSALTITGTTYATIDGLDYPSSDFAAAGDGVEGRYGSSLDMT